MGSYGAVPGPTGREQLERPHAYKTLARPYRRHEADKTVLYRIVAQHLETFLDEVHDHYDKPLPAYVEKELREFMKCGLLPYGFLRARCKTCGQELLVPLSCKRRGVCCSCNARRMCATAAHLTDRVIPDVPLRQWVLSVPYELRLLLARNADALSAVGRIFVQEILRSQRQQAQTRRLAHTRGAAVLFPQRFGSSINLNVHYHAAVPDGVFLLDEQNERSVFHELAPPDPVDLDTIALNVDLRATRWLERHHLLRHPDEVDSFSQLEPERTPLEACLEGSLGIGELTTLRAGQAVQDDEQLPPLPRPSRSARKAGRSRGFDVHAGVVVSASDREGRERLLRYCARPPLSLSRLSLLSDGRVAYALRTPWGKQTHRVMDPLAFMARLVALIPPPYHPLIRFHGLFAPHCSWRGKVVAQSTDGCRHGQRACCASGRRATAESCDRPVAELGRGQCHGSAPSRSQGEKCSDPRALTATRPVVAAVLDSVAAERICRSTADKPVHCAPQALRAASSRIPWAELLKRVHDVDALQCPCGGRLRFISLILEPEVAREILESLHLPSEPPPVARARSPDVRDEVPVDW